MLIMILYLTILNLDVNTINYKIIKIIRCPADDKIKRNIVQRLPRFCFTTYNNLFPTRKSAPCLYESRTKNKT